MQPDILYKQAIQTEGTAWAFDNTGDASTLSNIFYALAVPQKPHPLLGHFSRQEEKDFWELAFAIAQEKAAHSKTEMIIGVNDGVHSGQTVPHTHAHIGALHKSAISYTDRFCQASGRNFACEFEAMRKGCTEQKKSPEKIAVTYRSLNKIGAFVDELREMRQVMASHHGNEEFRIYTGEPVKNDKGGIPIIIEVCDDDHPQFSVAGGFRLLNRIANPDLLLRPFRLGRFSSFEML